MVIVTKKCVKKLRRPKKRISWVRVARAVKLYHPELFVEEITKNRESN